MSGLHLAISEAGYGSLADAVLQVPLRYDPMPCAIAFPTARQVTGETLLFEAEVHGFPPTQLSMTPPRYRVRLKIGDTVLDASGSGVIGPGHPLHATDHGSPILVSGIPVYLDTEPRLCEAWVYARDAPPSTPVYVRRSRVKGEVLRRGLSTAVALGEKAAVKRIRQAFAGLTERQILEVAGVLSQDRPFKDLAGVLRHLHQVTDPALSQAAARYATALSIGDILLRVQRQRQTESIPGAALTIDPDRVKDLIRRLPFKPTQGQMACMRTLWRGLTSDIPFRGLLSGDTGMGKSLVFGVLAVAASAAGYPVCIYTPNAPLAAQLHDQLKAWYPEVDVALVTAKSKPVTRDNTLLVGTSALFGFCKSRGIEPRFLVVDEQQKSSSQQRGKLVIDTTHLLEATATMIPRSGAMILYGGFDLILLNEQPVVKSIRTELVYESGKETMFRAIRRTIQAGGKVAVVLPLVSRLDELVGDSEKDKLTVETALSLWETLFPGLVVGIHGRMKEQEKLAQIEAIKRGGKQIVIGTSLLEIGVDIPNLRALVVVEADRLGVSSLHQLRGRLARNGGEGLFYMYLKKDAADVAETTRQRMQLLVDHTDGYVLAEKDMLARGFGDVSLDADKQAGEVVTLFGNIRFYPEDVDRVMRAIEKRGTGMHQGLNVKIPSNPSGLTGEGG